MARLTTLAIFLLGSSISLAGCRGLVIDTERLLKPSAELSEIVGLLAGFGTTFAAFPDLLAMVRRRSSEGMNPRMGAIMGAFQVLWVCRRDPAIVSPRSGETPGGPPNAR